MGMLVVCGGWDCWECQAPGTPILRRVRTLGVVFATESPADFDRLGVTFLACNSQLRADSAKNRAVINWFRLLSHCLGRTGRHRRTRRNRSVL